MIHRAKEEEWCRQWLCIGEMLWVVMCAENVHGRIEDFPICKLGVLEWLIVVMIWLSCTTVGMDWEGSHDDCYACKI